MMYLVYRLGGARLLLCYLADPLYGKPIYNSYFAVYIILSHFYYRHLET